MTANPGGADEKKLAQEKEDKFGEKKMGKASYGKMAMSFMSRANRDILLQSSDEEPQDIVDKQYMDYK